MVLLAQLVRAFVCGTKGREFDSHITHKIKFGEVPKWLKGAVC